MTQNPLSDIERFESFVEMDPNSGCWLWSSTLKTKQGYGAFRYRGRQCRAHRVAWILYRGDIPKGAGYHGTCVCHRCDTPQCVNPDHLFLGSNSENMADRYAKGRYGTAAKGTKNGNVRLKPKDIPIIRALLRQKVHHAEIAAMFNVSKTPIGQIGRNETWKHIGTQEGDAA